MIGGCGGNRGPGGK